MWGLDKQLTSLGTKLLSITFSLTGITYGNSSSKGRNGYNTSRHIEKIELVFDEKELFDFLSRNDKSFYSNKKNRQKKCNLNLHFSYKFFNFRIHNFIFFYYSKFLHNCNYLLLKYY